MLRNNGRHNFRSPFGIQPSLVLDFAGTGTLDPRVTFTRSTTAPYYDGKTSVLAEQNLFTYSQDFTSSNWTKTGSVVIAPVVTGNATTAPDGTTTASQIVYPAVIGTNAYSILFENPAQQINSLIYTDSIYLKGSVGGEVIYLMFTTNGVTYVKTTCALTTSWQRFTLNHTAGATGNYVAIGVDLRDTTQSAQLAQTIYAWGAQLEQRSSVTAYNATTTSAITNYIPQLLTAPINQPRFDFNPTTGESLGLLIEQSSTNLLFQSQTFNNLGVWAVANATLTANANIAPDGTQTVFQLIPSASSTFTNVGQSITATSQAYTTSWYVKYNGVQFVQILFGGGLSTNYANYDLINGTVTGGTYTSATITPIGNGMYRISTTNTFAATSSGIYLAAIATGTSARASNYTGNGYSGIYIWGAQLEALAFPTSYIPTTSAQVTRASDNASMTGTNFSSWYNNAQGTVYVETSRPTNVGQNTAYTISDGSTGNNIIWTTYNTSLYETIIKNSGTTSADMFASITYLANFPYKNAVTYASNSFAVVLNGAAPLTDSSGLVPVSCSALYLGSTWVNSVYLNGWIKKFAYYPQALTSAQLQALTGS